MNDCTTGNRDSFEGVPIKYASFRRVLVYVDSYVCVSVFVAYFEVISCMVYIFLVYLLI